MSIDAVLDHAVHAYKVAVVARMAVETEPDGIPTMAVLEASIREGVRAAVLAAVPGDPSGFSAAMVLEEANNWTSRATGKEMLLNYAGLLAAAQGERA